MPELLDEARVRSLVLHAHGRLRVPARGELDDVLAGYDGELERGRVLAVYSDCDVTVVQVYDEPEARRLPELGGSADHMWFLLGTYAGGPLFGEGWRQNVEGAPENTVLAVSAHGRGFRWQRRLAVLSERRVVLRTAHGSGISRPEVYLRTERALTLPEILERDRSVLNLPEAGVAEIDCDDPEAVLPHIRLVATPFVRGTKPLDLRINGIPWSVASFGIITP